MLSCTPGLGLSYKRLIFKENENVVNIARERGSGLAHCGLLAGSSSSCTPVVLPIIPCSDEQSDRLEESLKFVSKGSGGIISSVLVGAKILNNFL